MAQPILSGVTKNGLQYMILLNEDAPPTLWSAKAYDPQWTLIASLTGRGAVAWQPYLQHAAFAPDLDDGHEWQIACTDGRCVMLMSLDGRTGFVLHVEGQASFLTWVDAPSGRRAIFAVTSNNVQSWCSRFIETKANTWLDESTKICQSAVESLGMWCSEYPAPNMRFYLVVFSNVIAIGTYEGHNRTNVLRLYKFTKNTIVAWSPDSSQVLVQRHTHIYLFDNTGNLKYCKLLTMIQDIRWFDAFTFVIATNTRLHIYVACVCKQIIDLPFAQGTLRISPNAHRIVCLEDLSTVYSMFLRRTAWSDRVHKSIVAEQGNRDRVLTFVQCMVCVQQPLPTELWSLILQLLFPGKYIALYA